MKFKIGQKVKVISKRGPRTASSGRSIGDTFTVKYIGTANNRVCTIRGRDWCDNYDLDLVVPTIFTKLPQ